MAVAVTIGNRRTRTTAKAVSGAGLRCLSVLGCLSTTQGLSQAVEAVVAVVDVELMLATLVRLEVAAAAGRVLPTQQVESGATWLDLVEDQQVLRVHHLVPAQAVAAALLATAKMEISQQAQLEGLVADGAQADRVDLRPVTRAAVAAVQEQQYPATAISLGLQQEHV